MEETQKTAGVSGLTCCLCKGQLRLYKILPFKSITIEKQECLNCWKDYDIYKKEGVVSTITLPAYGTA